MTSQSIQDLMTSHPRVCTPADVVVDVARVMRDADVGSLPVVDGPESLKLIGMVTDRDIVCRVVAEGLANAPVAQAMSQGVVALTCSDTVDQAVHLMGAHQVRRLPVVDGDGCVVGIVAQADLALANQQQGDLEDELAEVIEEVSEPSTEARA